MTKDIQRMGLATFVRWEKIDEWCRRWAKDYFGDHADAEAERDEEDFGIGIVGLKEEDKGAFSELFVKYDEDGDYDPEEEFETGDSRALLPVRITIGIMNAFAGELGLKRVGKALANYNGVYFMENEQ